MSGLTPIIAYQDPKTGTIQTFENKTPSIESRTMDNIEITFSNAFKRSAITRNLSFAILGIILVVFAFLAVKLKDPYILASFLVMSGIIIFGVNLAVKSDNMMTRYIIGSFERLISSMFPTKELAVEEGKVKKEK